MQKPEPKRTVVKPWLPIGGLKRGLIAMAALCALASLSTPMAAEPETPAPVPVSECLVLGPEALALPAFHAETGGRYSLSDWLEGRQVKDLRRPEPHAGLGGP